MRTRVSNSLAGTSGVTRAALYSTYLHLKEEFERRRDQLRAAGVVADQRVGQIERLKEQVDHLKKFLASQEERNAELAEFRVQAVSRLTAQQEEISRVAGRRGDPTAAPQRRH